MAEQYTGAVVQIVIQLLETSFHKELLHAVAFTVPVSE